ncbi:MAG: aspartate kinase [Clostridia bacterium]|nr:aspartate kinase [Clostridia bacterium]
MDTIVLKFGGSSVADNEKLELVAEKIIGLYQKKHNVVVVVSAQGKTTDNLISEAKELSQDTQDREMDVLLSTGEQMSTAKLSMLLNHKGYPAISLTGWQAGIYTNNTNQNAVIKWIDTSRIRKELEKRRIVIIAGFQGMNENMDITTLGRGGSDTTAVAISAVLGAKNCYIFSDVDGVYTSDPNKLKEAKKLSAISYEEMLALSSEGAKVLHNRCVEIGEKFKVPIITKSTFNNKAGTVISDIIEENTLKSIVKKDISRISIVGNGIIRNFITMKAVLDIIEKNKLEMLEFSVEESKISITFKEQISDQVLEQIHTKLIKED